MYSLSKNVIIPRLNGTAFNDIASFWMYSTRWHCRSNKARHKRQQLHSGVKGQCTMSPPRVSAGHVCISYRTSWWEAASWLLGTASGSRGRFVKVPGLIISPFTCSHAKDRWSLSPCFPCHDSEEVSSSQCQLGNLISPPGPLLCQCSAAHSTQLSFTRWMLVHCRQDNGSSIPPRGPGEPLPLHLRSHTSRTDVHKRAGCTVSGPHAARSPGFELLHKSPVDVYWCSNEGN